MPAEPAIEARGLGHHYGRQRALAGVDITVPAGATCAVMGPNGAGKSTLLRLVAGLLSPTGGELRLFGQPARGDRPDLRRRIGLLGHESFLYARLTAAENLVFYATLYGLDRPAARAATALAEVGLADHGGRDRRRLQPRHAAAPRAGARSIARAGPGAARRAVHRPRSRR